MKRLIIALILFLLCYPYCQSQPFPYKGTELITIVFQTSPELITKLVPKPLIANSGGVMSISIGLQKWESGFSYHEMYFAIPVEYNGKKGSYIPLLYLNKALPITIGREIWGFPKYEAELDFQVDDKNANASVYKDGKLLIEAKLELGNIINKTIGSDPLVFTLKSIPSVEEGVMDVKKLNSVYLSQYTYTKYQEAKANLVINDIQDGSIGEIPIIKVLSASYNVTNFIFGFGKTEYNYLK